MTESTESNLLTMVKPRSTRVITPKTSPLNPLNLLTKPTHTRGQPVVKGTIKPCLTIDVGECRPELLLLSPKFT
jgi:hypothetical protein